MERSKERVGRERGPSQKHGEKRGERQEWVELRTAELRKKGKAHTRGYNTHFLRITKGEGVKRYSVQVCVGLEHQRDLQLP